MKMLISLILALSLCSCHSINQRLGLADDNPIEESAEKILETTIDHYVPLHLDIDFTPGSPEPKDL